jgi:hypothetical protein
MKRASVYSAAFGRRAVAALAGAGKLRVGQGLGTFVEAAQLITYRVNRRRNGTPYRLPKEALPLATLSQCA